LSFHCQKIRPCSAEVSAYQSGAPRLARNNETWVEVEDINDALTNNTAAVKSFKVQTGNKVHYSFCKPK
jgi:hypothetical protein